MFGQLAAPKNLCILRLSAIGDVCHAVAAVQNIQKHWPHTQVTWVCGKVEANLLKGLDKVEIVAFDKSSGLAGYLEFRDYMKRCTFNVLLHMQTSLRSSLLSFLIPAPIKIGFDSKRAIEGQSLFTTHKIEPQFQPHVLDGFMAFTEALDMTVSEPKWDIPLSDSDKQWVIDALPEHVPIAAICPAASKSERNWHVEGYAKTAEYLESRGFQVIVCGGPTDMEVELAKNICNASNADIMNLVGKTSLKQLLGLLKLAYITIAPDTGPAHMSVTVGTPVVGLYAHSNPLRTGPYLYQKYVASCYETLIEEQFGKPFTELSWGVRAQGKDLMHGISTELVQEKIDLVISDFYPNVFPESSIANT